MTSFPSLLPVLKPGLLVDSAALFALATSPLLAQSSTYLSAPDSADYSGMTAAGGTILLPYTLAFGEAPPGVGNSFTVEVHVSAITSYVSGNSYEWTPGPASPTLGVIGNNYPANVFSNLPVNNQKTLSTEVDGVVLESGVNTRLWMEANMNAGNLDFLGEFTITIGTLPALPPHFYASLELNILSEFHQLLADSNTVYAGIWSTPSPPLEPSNEDAATAIRPFGQSVTYQFTAFSDGIELPITSETPVWALSGVVQFDVIPEPSSMALLLIVTGAFALKFRRPNLNSRT